MNLVDAESTMLGTWETAAQIINPVPLTGRHKAHKAMAIKEAAAGR